MIELMNVTKQYSNASVLKNVTLLIDEPGIYCLLGRNGAGKTTLLKSIAGFQNITHGKIEVDGKVITTSTLDTGVSYIENFAKHFNLSVRKLLRIASEVNANYNFAFATEMMERFELDGKKKFNHLSLGMKTMVFLHVLLSMQSYWYGWLTDGVLVAIICIVTPVTPLRNILAGFFKVIMFNRNALLHIGICLLLSAALSLIGLTVLKRKTL